jgi:heterodisulfide reductase subunit B
MGSIDRIDLSYFPGCSLATTAKESNESLMKVCEKLGLNLIELEDWNCCGSSSAHSLDKSMAFSLPARNLSLAPSNRPLLVMCPPVFTDSSSHTE